MLPLESKQWMRRSCLSSGIFKLEERDSPRERLRQRQQGKCVTVNEEQATFRPMYADSHNCTIHAWHPLN